MFIIRHSRLARLAKDRRQRPYSIKYGIRLYNGLVAVAAVAGVAGAVVGRLFEVG